MSCERTLFYHPAGTSARYRQTAYITTDPLVARSLIGVTLVATIKSDPTSADATTGNISLTVANGGVEIIDAVNGIYDLIFLPATTATMPALITWHVQPKLTYGATEIYTPAGAAVELRIDPTYPCEFAEFFTTVVRGDTLTVVSSVVAPDSAGVSSQFTTEEVANASGNTTLTLPVGSKHHTVTLAVSGATRTSVLILSTTNAVAGSMMLVRVENPETGAQVITEEIRNATVGGTLLYTYVATGDVASNGPDNAFFQLRYNGTAWKKVLNLHPIL